MNAVHETAAGTEKVPEFVVIRAGFVQNGLLTNHPNTSSMM
jgi:hypothetical protein